MGNEEYRRKRVHQHCCLELRKIRTNLLSEQTTVKAKMNEEQIRMKTSYWRQDGDICDGQEE